MPTVKELREQRGQLNHKSRQIIDKAESENRDLTAEEDQTLKDLHDEDLGIKNRIDRLERLDQWDSELNSHADSSDPRRRNSRIVDLRDDPQDREELQRLARNAWARNQFGEDPTESERNAAESLGLRLDTKNLKVELDPWASARVRCHEVRNALTTGQPSKGGTLVRPGTAMQIEMAMLAFGPMLQEADVTDTDSGNDLKFPTTNDTSNEGEIVGENKETGEQDLSTGGLILGAHEFSSKLIIVSQAMIEDSATDIVSMIFAALGERIGRALNRKATVGIGGGSEPQGVVTGATVGKTAASATAITADEVLELIHSVDPSYRSDPSFRLMMHDNVVLALRKLKDSNGQYLWQPSLSGGVPDRFGNVPVLINQHMASTIATGNKTILAGALRKYKIRRVRQVLIRRMTEKYALQNADGFVAFLRADGGLVDAGTNPVKVLQQA